jgi:hypothetical protein
MNKKNRVLGVITYNKANSMCKDRIENWKHYTGADKVLFSGGNKEFWSPSDAYTISVGEDAYPSSDPNVTDLNLPIRLMKTLAKLVELADEPENAEVILIEPDVWFWDYIPLNEGFTGCKRLNSKIDETDERVYWHWPYIIAGKNNAINLLCTMKTLLKYNASCNPWGSYPDRFMGLALELTDINVVKGNQVSFDRLGKNNIGYCAGRRRTGAYAIHGIKSWDLFKKLR